MDEAKRTMTGVSILRFILAYLVVMCHFFDMQSSSFISFFSRMAVPCFTILSFFFYASKLNRKSIMTNTLKRVKRLFVPLVFWGGIYAVLYSIIPLKKGAITATDFLWQCFTGHSYNLSMWFISNQIIILFVVGFIFLAIQGNVLGWIVVFLMCIFVQYSGMEVKMLLLLNDELSTVIARIPEMMPYAVIGLYLGRNKEKLLGSSSSKKPLASVLPLILWISVLIVYKLPIPEPQGCMYQGVKLIMASTLFTFSFLIMPIGEARLINSVSKYSFGIYCLHMVIGECVVSITGLSTFGIIGCAVIYVISLTLSILIGRIQCLKKMVT